MDAYRKLNREHAELGAIGRALQLPPGAGDIVEAQEMLNDPDMKEFAQEEIQAGKQRIEDLQRELQTMLLPKDPNDRRNILLEIRAGTVETKLLCSLATYCVCTPAMPNAIAGKSRSCRNHRQNSADTKKSSYVSLVSARIQNSNLNQGGHRATCPRNRSARSHPYLRLYRRCDARSR